MNRRSRLARLAQGAAASVSRSIDRSSATDGHQRQGSFESIDVNGDEGRNAMMMQYAGVEDYRGSDPDSPKVS